MSAVDVVGVGLATVDEVFRVPTRPEFGASLRAAGHARACGGPAATALACLARLGVSTRFVGRVGGDAEGAFLRQELAGRGVDVTRLRFAAGARTRIALVLVEAGTGERGFVSWPESCAPLTADDIEPADIAGARVLHVDDADEAAVRAAQLARAAGAAVVLDGTWLSPGLPALLPLVDWAVVSAFFARRWLPGAHDETVLRRLVAAGAGAAVLTLGAAGSVALAGDRVLRCPAFRVDAIDTTGAGDAFHGGFIYGLLRGWPPERSLRFASATAALNCRALGGQAGLPTLAEVETLLGL